LQAIDVDTNETRGTALVRYAQLPNTIDFVHMPIRGHGQANRTGAQVEAGGTV